VLLSIVATETSTVTFLSIPGLAYRADGGNLLFLQLMVGYILGRFVVVFLFLPHYFRGDLFTAYEVLNRRFGGATKQSASVLFLVTRNLADGLRLFLTALVLQQVLGLDLCVSIIAVGILTIVYTFAGGMRSVVWNDCIQFAVYIGGALLAGAIILVYLGSGTTELTDFSHNLSRGWRQMVEFGDAHHKFRLFDFSPNLTQAYTFWTGLFGGLFVALATHGTDQLMVQRYLSARSQRAAGLALGVSGFVVCAQFALFLLLGVGLACFYAEFEPGAVFESNDQVFAAFIVKYLPVGVVGIIVAAVFSAAMSTLSGSLNSSAATAVNDLYLPCLKTKPPERHLLWMSRGLTVAFGLFQIGVAMIGPLLAKSVVESVMAIATFTCGVILGVFFLGVLTRRASQRAALIGLIGGLAIMASIVFSTELTWAWHTVVGNSDAKAVSEETTHELAWTWYAVVGSSITFALGYAASLLPPAGAESGD
jgi:SSS family transporter